MESHAAKFRRLMDPVQGKMNHFDLEREKSQNELTKLISQNEAKQR
jgi:hypothetical protein